MPKEEVLTLARPPKCRCICSVPKTTCFEPHGQPGGETVNIGYDEYEVIRLLDYELLSQKQCCLLYTSDAADE